MSSRKPAFVLLVIALLSAMSSSAAILWSDKGGQLIHDTGPGKDILGAALKRGDASSDTLYFKFHVDPLSDVSTEKYFAGFQLYEGDTPRLGVGNSTNAWAYSAFNTSVIGTNNTVSGDVDLKSSHPEFYDTNNIEPYELPRRGTGCTIVFRVQYVPHTDDVVTVWMNPSLSKGATDGNQSPRLTTQFRANACFDEIRLRHGGLGRGWIFSDMAIATSFEDFVRPHFWQEWWFDALVVLLLLTAVAAGVRFVEKRKFLLQLQHSEQEHAVERERARIARDLHDDLGSLLTRISLLGGLLHADKDNPAQVDAHAQKISQSADQTVRALEEIVWAVRPASDTLQGLVDYIAHFANELFDGHATRCRLDLPRDLPAIPVQPDIRHNIFLIVKEALNNALKHAAATEVHLLAKISKNILEICIDDNGEGFTPAAAEENGGHGLRNMRQRAESLNGTLSIESDRGKGTTVRLRVPLSNHALPG
ncbi:MAG TPA: sensor histidine kinase [Candidatus Angelobacter sp.]|nr:sensor histidine kinase [Candidatus Angelobacter sp.]